MQSNRNKGFLLQIINMCWRKCSAAALLLAFISSYEMQPVYENWVISYGVQACVDTRYAYSCIFVAALTEACKLSLYLPIFMYRFDNLHEP